jgi:hypothetical protein
LVHKRGIEVRIPDWRRTPRNQQAVAKAYSDAWTKQIPPRW